MTYVSVYLAHHFNEENEQSGDLDDVQHGVEHDQPPGEEGGGVAAGGHDVHDAGVEGEAKVDEGEGRGEVEEEAVEVVVVALSIQVYFLQRGNKGLVMNMSPRLRDPACWLSLATATGSDNLAPIFFIIPDEQFNESKFIVCNL